MPVFLRYLLRLGPTNPIAVRLVQGGSRRTRHFYIRAAYLGVLIAVLLYALLLRASGSLDYRSLAAAGAFSFTFVAYLQIALIAILAPVFMAGAIAQEASPRTWDILLTTPLSATQVVLGNLLGRLFFILALLFSSLPLFAVTQYFGGVPGSSIFTSYLIAACAATFVAAAAVALSVSRLVGKRAVFTFYVSIVSFLAVTFAIDRVVTAGGVTYMTAINPFLALNALLDPTGYPAAQEGSVGGLAPFMLEAPVRAFCTISAGLSVALILASILTVRAGGLSTFTSGASGVPWYRSMFGLAAKGAEHRAPRSVWNNPIIWREAAARNATLGRMVARWSFIAIGLLFAVGVVVYYHTGAISSITFRLIILYASVGEIAVVSLVAVNMAATSVTREREDGTLDLLLTTPITPGAYLAGKLSGMIAYLLPLLAVPVGTLALAGLYTGGVLGGLWQRSSAGGPGVTIPATVPGTTIVYQIPVVLPEAFLVVALVSVPFIAFCVMVGLQWSLKSKGSLSSVVATVGVVGVIAGIVGLCSWHAGQQVPLIGPALAALSPVTAVFAVVEPESALYVTLVAQSGPSTARGGLLIGALVAAALYCAIVYGIRANMVRTFDFTVRKLAGTK
ncbi:MAG: ABC transporter permease subunit [Phycisphaeraceae bacterium]|nr:ABC transporter permease subunit [Phycisphaeraceae bacterium]